MRVENYLNKEGKIKVWPSGQEGKLAVVRYLGMKFEFGRDYTEKEVNRIVDENHTFGDYFLLRRELIDRRVMARTPDGARYWRLESDDENGTMKQGKVVILGGAPRAGKTTLAVRLARIGFSKFSFDDLSEALHKGFPEIVFENRINQEACAGKLYPFFESLVGSAVHDAWRYGLNTVFDVFDFTPEYVARLPYQNDIEAYFLAYPGITADEIRFNIRHYAHPDDWIAQVDEEYLGKVAERCFLFNKKLAAQCGKYGYELVDTGAGDGRDHALDRLLQRITHTDN